MTERSGIILAGGQSTRFAAGDKATAQLGDRPLIMHVAARLDRIVDEIVVNCREQQHPSLAEVFAESPYAPAFAIDTVPDRGPVAGMAEGFATAHGDTAAVVACDMPFVDPAVLTTLFALLEGDRSVATLSATADELDGTQQSPPFEAVVPKLSTGWFQTTQAVYDRKPALQACRDALAADERKILAPLSRLDWLGIPAEGLPSDTQTFENINTVADLEAAESKR